MTHKTLLLLALIFPSSSALAGTQEEMIQNLPIPQCERDLRKLHEIYGQLRAMSASEGQTFLALIAEDLKGKGSPLPPPPKPCSSVHFAIERRCGNVLDASKKCSANAAVVGGDQNKAPPQE